MANVAGFWGLVIAFVLAGFWEVGEPAREALIVDLAPEGMRGRAVGLYYLLRNLAVVPAASWAAIVADRTGPDAMFYAAFTEPAAGVRLLRGPGALGRFPSDRLNSPVGLGGGGTRATVSDSAATPVCGADGNATRRACGEPANQLEDADSDGREGLLVSNAYSLSRRTSLLPP